MTGETVITLSLAQALMLTAMLAGSIGGVIWWLIRELGETLKQQVDAKFRLFEEKLADAERSRKGRDDANEERHAEFSAALARIERDLLEHKQISTRELLEYKAEAERQFTRREDTVRDSATLHAKLDALASRIEMTAQLLARVVGLTKEA